ncbi:MAG: hypothetical protein J1E03_04390 [Acetatifactor sp.]|nr:hypothetical protein [Acetatifactor sp.]
MEYFDRKELRVLYVASQCIFYLLTFKVEKYEKLILESPKYEIKEDVLNDIYKTLLEKNDDYYKLISYFEDEIGTAQDDLIFGIFSISQLTRAQFASNILIEIELLDGPMTSTKIHSNMPEDF